MAHHSRRRSLRLALLCALLATATAAAAGGSLTPYVGWVFGARAQGANGELRLREASSRGLRLDIPYAGSRWRSLRLGFSRYHTALDEYPDAGPRRRRFDLRVDDLRLGGTTTLDAGWLRSYLLGSFGLTRFRPADPAYDSETLLSFALGLGLRKDLGRRGFIDLEGRVLMPLNVDGGSLFCAGGQCDLQLRGDAVFTQGEVGLGMGFRF